MAAEEGKAMEFNDLTEEQKEMARACKSQEELIELAKKSMHKLSDDELETISGGLWNCACDDDTCGKNFAF